MQTYNFRILDRNTNQIVRLLEVNADSELQAFEIALNEITEPNYMIV